MGFGRDRVNGRYKIVRMHFDSHQTEILDIAVGQWIKLLNRPHYYVDARTGPSIACITYLVTKSYLHTGKFRNVSAQPSPPIPSEIANLEGRLTVTVTTSRGDYYWFKIWSMDPREETWSNTYTIAWKFNEYDLDRWKLRCRPLAVSKRGKPFASLLTLMLYLAASTSPNDDEDGYALKQRRTTKAAVTALSKTLGIGLKTLEFSLSKKKHKV